MTPATRLLKLPAASEKALWMRNYLIACRAVGAQTNGALAVMEFTVAQNDGPPPHTHQNEDETYYVLDGTFVIQVGTRTFEVTPGGCVVGPRGMPHAFRNVGSAPGRLLVIATPAAMERYHEEAGQVAMARTLPPQPVPLRTHEAARLAQKYRFHLQGDTPMPVSEPVRLPSAAERMVWMRNFLIECRALAADTSGTLSVLEFTVAHGDGPPCHTHHNEDETFLVLDGTFLIQIGETRYEAGPGGCVFGPRHLPHGFVNAGPDPGRLLVIATPAGIEEYFAESGRPAAARTLPEPAGAPDLELASRLGEKYRFDVVGPPLHVTH